MQESTPCSSHTLALAIKQATWSRFEAAYRKKFKKDYEPSLFIVLSSIAVVKPRELTFQLAVVGEGTKSLPRSAVNQGNSKDLLQDMHGEMLALRGMRRFLLEDVRNGEGQYFSWSEKKGKYALKKEYEIWLYCSEVFCGDCCISHEKESFSGAKPLAFLSQQNYPDLKYQQDVLRTKPGRLDLPLDKRSAVLSCSDLIGIGNILGIQGKPLFSIFTPIYLSKVIIDGPLQLKPSLERGISLPLRLQHILHRPSQLINRQIFNIMVQGKQRRISSQFYPQSPELILLQKKEGRDRQGFELCCILTDKVDEWINGRTGLPQGSSLKNYREKGKISKFSESCLEKQFQSYRSNELSFKYEAILGRIGKLFGEWMQGAGQ